MKRTIVCILTLLCLALGAAFGQSSIDQLNAEIKRAEREIAKNEKLLKEVTKSKKTNQTEIKLLQAKINNRTKVVSSLNKQIDLISSDISKKRERHCRHECTHRHHARGVC